MDTRFFWGGSVLLLLVILPFVMSVHLGLRLGVELSDIGVLYVVEFIQKYGLQSRAGEMLWDAFLVGGGITMFLALALGFFSFYSGPTWFGDARWLRPGELRKARLLDRRGLILGKQGRRWMHNDEAGHLLLAAPTRSGKGVGVVIPNLLAWPGAAIVLDIKHENYRLTAGYRHKELGQEVFKWAPMDKHSHRFNPLDFISADEERVSQIQMLSNILVRSSSGDPMWASEARSLFVGLVLLVLDDPDVPSTLGQVYATLNSAMPLDEIAAAALERPDVTLHSSCVKALNGFRTKAPKEQSGVRSTLSSALNLWANPTIDAATAASDFDLRAFRRRPASVYVGVAQDQLDTLAPLLNLFFQQAVNLLGRREPGPAEPHEVLFLIDEFPTLGKMETIQTALALLASYKVRITLIVQGLGQLEAIYGKDTQALLQNCRIQIFFASNDSTTTRYVSEQCGTITQRVRSRSQSQDWLHSTTSTSYTAQPLIRPEKVRTLRPRKMIVLKENTQPVLANKLRYFTDRTLKGRAEIAPPAVPALVIQPASDPADQAARRVAQPPPEGTVSPDDLLSALDEGEALQNGTNRTEPRPEDETKKRP